MSEKWSVNEAKQYLLWDAWQSKDISTIVVGCWFGIFFPPTPAEEVSIPVVCCNTDTPLQGSVGQYCKPDQWNYIGFQILPVPFFACVILVAHCRDPAHPLTLYLSDPVARQCYSLSWQKITHWRFRKIIQTDESEETERWKMREILLLKEYNSYHENVLQTTAKMLPSMDSFIMIWLKEHFIFISL